MNGMGLPGQRRVICDNRVFTPAGFVAYSLHPANAGRVLTASPARLRDRFAARRPRRRHSRALPRHSGGPHERGPLMDSIIFLGAALTLAGLLLAIARDDGR